MMDVELSDGSSVSSSTNRRLRSTRSQDNKTGGGGQKTVPVSKSLSPKSAKILAPIPMRNGQSRKRRSNEDYEKDNETQNNKRRLEKLRHVERVANNLSSASASSSTSGRMRAGTSSGIIKSLKMIDFMCHQSFYQEWHENMNFVIGENGSGKSALLSGLLVGLGAKALSTSRTSSIKDLIKTGKSFAKIEVTLLNRGALCDELYGDEFTIQRILDIKGTSTYKLQKNGIGKFRPLRKQELDKILQDLNIQLENPVIILNQEYARSFLCSKNPKDKYKLFQDGIGAVQCEQTLLEVQDDLKKIKENLARKEEDKNNAYNKYVELEEKVKIIKGVVQYRNQLKALGIELAWAHVADDKKIVLKCKQEVEKCENSCIKNQTALDESLEKKRKFEEENAPSRNIQEERSQEQERLNKLMSSCRSVLATLRSEIMILKRSIAEKTKAIEHKKKYVSKLEEKAAQDNEKEKQDYERLKQQNAEEQETLSTKVSSLEQEVKTLKTDGEHFLQGAETIKKEIDEVKTKRREFETVINNKKNSLNRIKSSTNTSSYDSFGRCMTALMDKIKLNEHKFKELPRGPLGARFKVKRPEYAKIIQFVLGSKLFDFIVDNSKDATLMNTLITDVYGTTKIRDNPRPSVHLNKFCSAHNYANNNASKGIQFPTIIDMLEIDNNDHIITNALLDSCGAERILLFKDVQEALTIFTDKSTVPKTCMYGFTLDFYKVTPDPNLRVDVQYQKPNQLDVIRTSNSNQVRQLELDIRSLEEQMSQFVIDQNKVREERQLKGESEKRLSAYKQKRVQLTSLTLKLKSLKEMTFAPPDSDSRNEEILDTKEQIETLQTQLNELENKLRTKQPELDEKEKEKADIDKALERIGQELLNHEDQKERLKQQIRKLDQFIERFQQVLDRDRSLKTAAEDRLRVAEEKVLESTMKAQEAGDEVEVRRSIEAIKKESQLIKVKIDEIEKNVGNQTAIFEEHKIAKNRYKKISKHFDVVKRIHTQLDKYATKVHNYYFNSRNRIVAALIECFQSIVKSRNYKGQVVVDHDEKELYYFICPDKEASEKLDLFERNLNSAQYKKQMKEYVAGLSGGERSFSTICFIISLWNSAMKSPFYMLDEFDVFMDAINRKTSQSALMAHARAYPGNQFFFFTPLDLTSIPPKEESLVLRLFPPDRNSVNNGDENVVPTDDGEQPAASSSGSGIRRRRTESENGSRSAKASRKGK